MDHTCKKVKPVKMGYTLKTNGSHLEKRNTLGRMVVSWTQIITVEPQ